jgi:HK97 family phage major capsid protein
MKVTASVKGYAVTHLGCKASDGDAAIKAAVFDALGTGALSQEKFSELVAEKATTDAADAIASAVAKKLGGGNPLFGSGIRVKDASEKYDRTKRAAVHKKTGTPILFGTKAVEHPSQLDLARCGAWLMFRAAQSGAPVVLSDETKSLVAEIIEKETFAGEVNGVYHAEIRPEMVRAVLNDSTSGGSFVNPVFFDEAVTTFPLLSGEVFPFVDVRDVPRGSSIMGASMATPTTIWGTAEGTAQSVYDTTDLINELNSTVKPVMTLVEVGRDLASDVPIEIGSMLVDLIGERMSSELDRVCVVGNGTDEPAGIVGTAGITAVSSDNGVGGPPSVGDAENLIFAVPKAYRKAERNPTFIMNDTGYRRYRGVPVGPADERRVFGMDHQSYQMLEHRCAIANDLTNSQQLFGCLKSYRMYRRAGSEVRWIMDDATLAAKNLMLLVVRARYAGRVLDPTAFSMISDAQS